MVSRVMVDTSAIFALISSQDRFHAEATGTYTDILDRGDEILTTSYVLVEVSALVHRRLGFQPLRTFIHSIQDVWDIIWLNRIAHEEAWSRMEAHGGSQLSFVDWSTIVAAETSQATIFAFDQDFQREGVATIPMPGL